MKHVAYTNQIYEINVSNFVYFISLSDKELAKPFSKPVILYLISIAVEMQWSDGEFSVVYRIIATIKNWYKSIWNKIPNYWQFFLCQNKCTLTERGVPKNRFDWYFMKAVT